MSFDLGIFKKKNVLKNYKILIGFFLITGVVLILVNRYGPNAQNDSFISGIGAGFIFAFAPFVFYYYKKKSKEFDEALETQFTDERLIYMKQKVMAIAGVLAMIVNFGIIIASRYIEISLTIGSAVVLYTYCLSLIFLKLIYKNK